MVLLPPVVANPCCVVLSKTPEGPLRDEAVVRPLVPRGTRWCRAEKRPGSSSGLNTHVTKKWEMMPREVMWLHHVQLLLLKGHDPSGSHS